MTDLAESGNAASLHRLGPIFPLLRMRVNSFERWVGMGRFAAQCGRPDEDLVRFLQDKKRTKRSVAEDTRERDSAYRDTTVAALPQLVQRPGGDSLTPVRLFDEKLVEEEDVPAGRNVPRPHAGAFVSVGVTGAKAAEP
jgi:hypothetical protein